MKKIAKITVIISMLLVVILLAVGCTSAPEHNVKATLDNLKKITVDMNRDAVKAIMGEPFAYDAAQIDWDTHGYDTLIYSPNDLAIMDFYKTRSTPLNNLPGLTQHYKFTNKTWERKYYFGTFDSSNTTAQISYELYKVVYKNKKITYIEAIGYERNNVTTTNLYILLNDNNLTTPNS